MRIWVWVIAAVLVAATGTANASTLEDTTGICYQNDGQIELGTACDFPDSRPTLQAMSEPSACNTDVNVDNGRTTGRLMPLHQQPGVPEEDPADFCYAPINSVIPTGSLVIIDLNVELTNAGAFPMSFHLYDPATGEELGAGGEEAAASAATTDGYTPATVHSGPPGKPYHPVSVSEVRVNGVTSTFRASSPASVDLIEFVVKNTPQHITIDGADNPLVTGDIVRLCGFDGKLGYSLLPEGGHIKFEGTVEGLAMIDRLDIAGGCDPVPAPRVSCSSENGYQNQCQFISTPALPNVIFEIRAHPSAPAPAPLVPSSLIEPQPRHCHDACESGGGSTDWETLLESLQPGTF